MPQLINKKKKIYFYLFSFLLLSTAINQKVSNTIKEPFLVKKIIIKNLSQELEEKLLFKTNYLLNKNIFAINKNKISEELNNFNYLDKINIKKKLSINYYHRCKKNKISCINFYKSKKIYSW